MKRTLPFSLAALLVLATATAWAAGPDKASISTIATNPTSSIVLGGGNSRNAVLSSAVTPGASITLTFTLGVDATGASTSTTYPDTLKFSSPTIVKPDGASDATVSGLSDCNITARTGSACNESATVTAPGLPGAYQVKIIANDGRNGSGHMDQDFFILNFTVSNGCSAAPTTLTLTLEPSCALYHAPSDIFTATLTSNGTLLSGKTINFSVEGNSVGSVGTTNGVATLNYNPSALHVGDYTVSAAYQGDACTYDASSITATLGIQYLFLGFQQPINGDGSSVFTGKAMPVKIKIADYYGAAVPDANATVFYEDGTPAIVGTDPENATIGLNFDYGNVMRYDSGADQYVYNWDLGTVKNGTKTLRAFLGEGSCAAPRQIVVSIQRKK